MKPFLLVSVAAVMLAIAHAARADEPPAYVVVVNAATKVSSLSKGDLRAMFAKKTTRWAEDLLIAPFDLAPADPVRAVFSEAVFGKSPQAVLGEWRQRIFTGQGTPPQQVKDEAAMLAAVAATPGGLGYVRATAKLPAKVRAVTITD